MYKVLVIYLYNLIPVCPDMLLPLLMAGLKFFEINTKVVSVSSATHFNTITTLAD